MEFTEIIVGSSDEDSVSSQETHYGADDNWIRLERRYNDHFHVHEFLLRDGWEPIYNRHPDYFADDVSRICAAYEPGTITAIRLRATIIDETTGEVRERVRIRLEYYLFHYIDDLREFLLELVLSNLAPLWIRVEDFQTSDTAIGKIVLYDLSFFDLCIQKMPRTPFHTTMIVGNGEIHPGVWVKRIFTRDHHIEYGPKDCAIMCMNEATGKRLKPDYVKMCIWPQANFLDKLDLHRKKHLKALSRIYGTGIVLYSIDDSCKLVIGSQQDSVELVKVGKMVGVLDHLRQAPKPDEATAHSEGYFDLETVGEVQRVYAYCMNTPYGSCTVADADHEDVEEDIRNNVSGILQKIPEKETIIMYSWNGSRFDSYIMLRILAYKSTFRVDHAIINSTNELLTFRVRLGDNNGSMVFRDPCKLFPSTLEKAANILGLNVGKSDGVDHDEIECNFLSSGWHNYLDERRAAIMDYVQQDVRLLKMVVNGIRSLYSHKREYTLPIRVCLTRSMASNILWMKTLSKETRDQVRGLHIDPYVDVGFRGMQYMDIMKHAVGGRVQCVKRGTFRNVGVIDAKSMYPHVCANYEYPCGDTMFVRNYVPGKLGVYYVQILRQTIPTVIPYRRNRLDPYDWEYTGQFEKWVTSVDLEQMKGGYVVLHGIVWSDRTQSFFKSYMESLYHERQCASSDALNMHWKIFMNALTGSIFQAPLRDFTIIMDRDSFEETMKKYSNIIHVLSIDDLNDRDLIVIFRPVKLSQGSPQIRMQKEFCASAITSKPWILTMFIYAYARRKLRDKWMEIEANGKSRVLYCDTDSLLFTNCNHVHIEGGSNLGDWEKEHWEVTAILHASKVYAVGDKVRIKGISKLSQSLICNTEIEIPTFESFEEASCFFRAGLADGPRREHVKALVEGKHVYFMNWYMEKSRTKGIVKRYRIKHLKP